jgi:23S rRNA (pseudouridine1915-N3)-methyltransferase
MNHEIIVAGKPALKYAKDGTAEYLKRLTRYGNYKLTHIKDGTSEDVSKRLFDASKGTVRIVMDERGVTPTTQELVKLYNKWEMRGFKKVSFLIGASDGHTQKLRDEADFVLSLSSLTLMHELALVVLLEQIYRVATIKRGEPYHRD